MYMRSARTQSTCALRRGAYQGHVRLRTRLDGGKASSVRHASSTFLFRGGFKGVEIPGEAAAEAMWTECRQCAPIQLLIQSGKLFITPETKEPGDTRKSPNSLPCCQVLCVDR